jgi:hypothetical protein
MSKMSKSAEALRALGIVNPHEAIKYAAARGVGPGVYIHYRASDAQARIWSAWQVLRPGFRTDPRDLATMNRQQKTISVHGDRAAKLEEAKQWAGSRYGITEWDTIPGLPGEVFPKAIADLIKVEAAR